MDSEPKKIWLIRLQNWAVTLLAVVIAANAVTGIEYQSLNNLLMAGVLLSLAHEFVRPLLLLLALPLLLLTLTLFRFVINAFLLGIVAALVPGFEIHGFWPAFWGAITISLITTLLQPRTTRPVASPTGPSRVRPEAKEEPRRFDKNDPGDGPIIDV
jgi:putative membrane protein